MLGKSFALSFIGIILVAGVAFAADESSDSPSNPNLQGTTWQANRVPGNLEVSHEFEQFFFKFASPGTTQGSIESSKGTTANYVLVVYSEEDLLPPEPNTCKSLPAVPLKTGQTYYVARKPGVGALYIEQIEAGETWVFRLDDMVMIKPRPFVYGAEPSNVKVELFDMEGRLVTSTEIMMDKSSISRSSSSSGKGELLQQMLFIGEASSEEEFGLIQRSGREWLEIPLDGLGMIKAWSSTPGVSCKVYVDGVEVLP